MPSFLNKVFGYKKSDDKDVVRPTRETSDSTLLDGKYEAVPSLPSPSASAFVDALPTKDPDRDVLFSFFKARSRGIAQRSTHKGPLATPQLTLHLPGPKEGLDSRAFGAVFEADPDAQMILDDAVIAAKRLNPLQALILIKACAQAIAERGVETLGIMHPHWFSASPDAQRKLISLFIRSLTPQSRITTLSPTPTFPASAFENELHYTRSPHDVAAVLRWGLRHLSLENGQFGKDNVEWAWYSTFLRAERDASYPLDSFSKLLLPQLPTSHVELLVGMLNLVSSLAAHAELNSISGSKLSKFLGIWLLATTRAEQSDDWNRFYARWEQAGRILEHLFLARLRDESIEQRLPTRLQELIKHYPYNKDALATEDELLSRPRFSTRQYDALFVRVETLLMHNAEQPKQHPIQLLLEAFQLPIDNASGDEHVALWSALKTAAFEEAASSDPEGLQFTRVFVDETIQLLSLIPADNNVPTSPIFTTPITTAVSRKRSPSPTKVFERPTPRSNANGESTSASPTSPSSAITDWAQFSLSGFGDASTAQPLAALLYQEDDTEVTQPRTSRKSSRQRGKSRPRKQRSEDHETLDTPPSSQSKHELFAIETKLASVHVIQIDEAFIDFWSDAIVDPISADWPTFVVCGLKQVPGVEPPIHWVVIEQTYSRQQPQSSRVPSPDGLRGRSPRPSFRSDISGFRINSVFSSARKRFSAFSKSATDLHVKKPGGKTPVAGELGEILVEEETTSPSIPTPKADHHHIDENTIVGTTVTSGATTNVADQLKVDVISTVPVTGIPPADLGSVPKTSELPATAATVSSVEPTPQSGGGDNGTSALPRLPVSTSEEAYSGEQVAQIPPLAADTFDVRPIMQNPSGRTILAPDPAFSAEHPVTKDAQIRLEPFGQSTAVEATDPPVDVVPQPAGGEFTAGLSDVAHVGVAEGSREVAEVAMLSASETVAMELATRNVTDEAPKHIAEGDPHAIAQASQKGATECVAASAVESAGEHVMDDFPPVSAPGVQAKVIATEMGAQPELDSIASVASATEEATGVAEPVETPVLEEDVVLAETSADARVHAKPAQDAAAEPDALDEVRSQPVAEELQAPLEADGESAPPRMGEPSVEIILAVDTGARVVAVETEHTADEADELATEQVQQPLIQDTIVQATETPLAAAALGPEVEASVSAARDVAHVEAEAQAIPQGSVSGASTVATQDTGASAPAPGNAVSVDETPGLVVATDTCGPVKAAPEPEVADVEAPPTDPVSLDQDVQPCVEAEPSTQFVDVQPAEVLPTESTQEGPTSAVDEVITLEVKVQSTPHVPAEDAEASTSAVPESIAGGATEPIIKEAQVLVEDAVLSTDELVAVAPTAIVEAPAPVARDVQVLVEVEVPLSEPGPQSVDEAAKPPAVGVSPEEISSVDEEPKALNPPTDVVDAPQEVVGDAESALTPSVDVPVEDTQAVVDAGEPGTIAVEPELVEVGAPTPVIEEASTLVEAEEPSVVAGVSSQSEAAAPAVEADGTNGVNGPQEVVELAKEPVTFEDEVDTPAQV